MSNSKLFVSNLSYDCTEDEVISLFASIGEVASFRLIRDRFSGNSKGFGFMEMTNEDDANRAIEQLNGQEFKRRALVVKPQREDMRESRPRTGGGGGGGFNRGGGGSRSNQGFYGDNQRGSW